MTAAARLQAFTCAQMECINSRSLSTLRYTWGRVILKNGLERSQTHWMLLASADKIAAGDCPSVPLSDQ